MKLILFLILFTASWAQAQVQVAFMQKANYDGEVLVLENGFKYSHVAMSYRGKWYSFDLSYGLLKFDSMEMMEETMRGKVGMVLERPDVQVDVQKLENYFNRNIKGDIAAIWGDALKTNCSNFVGDMLDLKPSEMKFEGPHWEMYETHFLVPEGKELPRGELGISPKKIFQQLIGEKGFAIKGSRCEAAVSL